jgi:hypothetical protein
MSWQLWKIFQRVIYSQSTTLSNRYYWKTISWKIVLHYFSWKTSKSENPPKQMKNSEEYNVCQG